MLLAGVDPAPVAEDLEGLLEDLGVTAGVVAMESFGFLENWVKSAEFGFAFSRQVILFHEPILSKRDGLSSFLYLAYARGGILQSGKAIVCRACYSASLFHTLLARLQINRQ